jgi:DUF4097 and DUF4098 domain-containing protein YvlB
MSTPDQAMPTRTFATPRPVDLEVRNPVGSVDVIAADTDQSTVEVRPLADTSASREAAERTRVELSGDGTRLSVIVPDKRMVFRGTSVGVTVTVPTGSRVRLRVAVADCTCRGRLARLEAHTATGPVFAEDVTGDVEVHTASGEVRLGSTGRADVRTASGAVRIGSATGDVSVKVASGRVAIGTAERSVEVRSASGDISVDEVNQGRIELGTASGDLRVGVRAGAVARLDLYTVSGRARSELPVEEIPPAGGSTVEVRAKTVSGNVLVTRSAAAAA